jgi:hypothetical protein
MTNRQEGRFARAAPEGDGNMDVPYDKSAGRPICTRSARRGRHMDAPYETLTLIPAYMCFFDLEME